MCINGVLVGMSKRERKGVKIVLVNPPPNPEAFVDYQNPLIGLAYIAAVLEKNGYNVTVIDCPPFNMTQEDLRQGSWMRIFLVHLFQLCLTYIM